MSNIAQFLREVQVEMKKVSWPDRRQLVNYTLIVLGMSLFLAILLGALDGVFQFIVDKLV